MSESLNEPISSAKSKLRSRKLALKMAGTSRIDVDFSLILAVWPGWIDTSVPNSETLFIQLFRIRTAFVSRPAPDNLHRYIP